MSRLLPVVTNSAMRVFRRCQRLYFLMYVMMYRSVHEQEALTFGTLIHLGLEAWWRETDNRLDAALAALAAENPKPYDLARARVLLMGYDARWLADAPFFEVIAVEQMFRAPLLNPETLAASKTFDLGGKLDVIVRDLRDGQVKMIEHKTTSDDVGEGSDYWKRLVIDPQVSTYFAGGKASGYAIDTCIYDVIKKPGQRPLQVPLLDDDGVKIVLDGNGERVRTKDGKKWRESSDTAQGYVLQTRDETPEEFEERLIKVLSENPEAYYHRGTVVRLEAEEADAAYDTWHTARQIRDAELNNRWVRNPDSCVAYGTCAFFGVCTGTASLEDTEKFRRLAWPHEELDQDRINQHPAIAA
jgi:hypothetical protein